MNRTQEKLLISPAFKLETWCNTAIDCFFSGSWMSGSCSTLCVSDDSFCVSNGSLCDSDTFLCVSVSVMAVCDSYNYLIYVNYYTVCFSDNSFTCVFCDKASSMSGSCYNLCFSVNSLCISYDTFCVSDNFLCVKNYIMCVSEDFFCAYFIYQ